jgi:hypothetical protein
MKIRVTESQFKILSEDKQGEYIDRIFKDLVDNTIINDTKGADSTITYPFYSGDPEYFDSYFETDWSVNPSKSFVEYLKSYGLSDDEIYDLWHKYRIEITNRMSVFYQDYMDDKYFDFGDLNESVNISRKQRHLMNKIIREVIDGFKLKKSDDGIWIYSDDLDFLFGISDHNFFGGNNVTQFIFNLMNHLKLNYKYWGFTKDELDYITKEVSKGLFYTLFVPNNIQTTMLSHVNESDDKQKNFIEKVTRQIIKDSEIEVEDWYSMDYKCECGEEWEDRWSSIVNDRCPECNNEIEPHSYEDVSSQSFNVNISNHDALLTDDELRSTLYVPTTFKRYCKNNYGLTDEEIMEVWGEWRKSILLMYQESLIDESNDRQSKLKTKLIDEFISNTDFRTKDKYGWGVRFPHQINYFWNSYDQFRRFYKATISADDKGWLMGNSFAGELEEVYGFTEDESIDIMLELLRRINDKIAHVENHYDKLYERILKDMVDNTFQSGSGYYNNELAFSFDLWDGYIPSKWERHLSDVYGLKEYDIEVLWQLYNDEVSNYFEGNPKMYNESIEDKQFKYQEKIVDDFMGRIDIKELNQNKESYLPTNFLVLFDGKQMTVTTLKTFVMRELRDVFGVNNNQDRVLIWGIIKNKLLNNHQNLSSLKESIEREDDKFFKSFMTKLLNDTQFYIDDYESIIIFSSEVSHTGDFEKMMGKLISTYGLTEKEAENIVDKYIEVLEEFQTILDEDIYSDTLNIEQGVLYKVGDYYNPFE